MKKILSVLLLTTVSLCTMPLVGCTQGQTVNEINTILTEATNILVVAQPNAPWVPQLQQAIAALKAAEATWQSGGSVAAVTNALNTIVAVTAVIPITSKYSPLIDVLVAAIETVMNSFGLPPATTVGLAFNPHLGRVRLQHHIFHNPANEFKDAWNAAAQQNNLAGAVIK